jgi:predicted O-linked N-acetylglucosamine transferase (SPINDLY family)
LIFAGRTTPKLHMARQQLADLFLDTLPYNAHTTASDALWAGLPLVTLQGETFTSRVAASVLSAAGLSELVTRTLGDYEALALKLARDPAELARLKTHLENTRLTVPLFDTDRLRRNIESAYITMYERALRGEAPAGFDV